MRSSAGAKAVLGGEYPATSLYMTTDYVNSHKDLVQKLVNAYVATLAWIQGHNGAQIADKMPASYYAGVGKDAYAQALDNEKAIFNPTGIMPAERTRHRAWPCYQPSTPPCKARPSTPAPPSPTNSSPPRHR